MAVTSDDLRAYAEQLAAANDVSPELVHAIVEQGEKSAYRPDERASPKGAMGPMQLMPATARALGVNPADPFDNVRGGVQLISQLNRKYGGDPALVAAAYNAGEPAVDKAGGVPDFPETQAYSARVLHAMAPDPAKVKWDAEAPPDPAAVKWDDAPAKAAPKPPSDEQLGRGAILRGAMSGLPFFGEYLPEVAMGLKDTVAGTAQLAARGVEKLFPGAKPAREAIEGANTAADRAYQNNVASSAPSPLAASTARGVGASLPLLPITPAIPGAAARGIAGLAARVGGGAAIGGATAATAPVAPGDDYWQQKLRQVGTGAVVGGALPVVASAVGRVVRPRTDPNVQLLADEGVRMTPGQLMGGMVKSAEDKATSIPLFGDAINAGRRGSMADFNRAAYARALTPVAGEDAAAAAVKGMQPGHEAVGDLIDTLGGAYDKLLPNMKVSLDRPLLADMGQLGSLAQSLPKGQGEEFNRIVQQNVFDRFTPGGTISGETMKSIDSELGRLAAGYRGSADFSQRELGRALTQAQSNFRAAIARNNPQYAPQLRAIDQGYSNLLRVQKAAGMQGAEGGQFTPAQLGSAARSMTRSASTRARGAGQMQDLADAGRAVLPNKVPDSGTATRALVGMGLMGGAHLVNPAIVPAMGAAALAYTPTARRLLTTVLTQRPAGADHVAEALRQASVYAGAPAALSLLLGRQSVGP